ncbi:cupin domain-containing protein [Celeribacter halophilus]|jgi:quercetin dioxygenase-like cupin family protein|uniref:Cupin domain-containing protein n=1 Tax=Celeribacter halophilus TaxID=576117 RepID=A0AAW7XNQ4_9RHOB|nr:cupin domain-containing protein [Celeribacter halophilus]MBU2888363.1 cupin domain-containing protein [Celeribacter halophilus]MDO6455969.1 cupin domain-containing protein [Celeribacter halophilus]MDO6511918.1 cupin domain-containing protein [Celeribacter halophilus]MDO6724327.1 cupin domain-containing protein [Celeribacter halophilus]
MSAQNPELVETDLVSPVQLYDFEQKTLFSPKERGEGFIKLSVTTGKKGARSVAHCHPRDEVTLTLSGEAVLRANGQEFYMKPGTALRVPPGCVHEVEVLSEEWTVVAAYCDECQLCRP